MKAWLTKQADATPVAVPAQAAQPAGAGGMQQSMVSSALDRVKHHITRIVNAWPHLPQKFEQIRNVMMAEISDHRRGSVPLLVLLFVGVGGALSYVVYRLTHSLRVWTDLQPHNTPHGRVRKLGGRFLSSLLMVAAFTVGSAGAFLMFEWPPLLREIVLSYLTAAIIIWAVSTFTRAVLLPTSSNVEHAREVRAFNMSDVRADHWYRWIVIIVSLVSILAATVVMLPSVGFGLDDIIALGVPLNTLLLILGLAAVWLRPRRMVNEGDREPRLGHGSVSWLLTAYFVLLLLIRTSGAFVLFWFVVAAVAVPAVIVATHRAVHYILRPPVGETDARPIPPVTLAVVDRGIRMALIIFAAYLLAKVWGLDMASMENTNPTTTLILRGLLNAIVIILAADFGWSIIKALIGRKLGVDTSGGHDELQVLDPQKARLRTLLPIVQNIMFAVIAVMAILMILASVGIQIGPLIAGAGVIGVAVGFGAQTVVKDVISGVFYLLDDAFRVGEYISSGKYMGTVESFSLRSIKLRHHRGSLFTIPFGELGAVQNQSRDWVTDKFNITVGYDTDIEFARKLIKRIGLELAEDPEFKPWVIEPIKMQGVQEFGEYGVVLRIKVTMRPGGAFGMKRKFYLRVQQVFKQQGIELPMPTVHVQAHGADSSHDVPAIVPAAPAAPPASETPPAAGGSAPAAPVAGGSPPAAPAGGSAPAAPAAAPTAPVAETAPAAARALTSSLEAAAVNAHRARRKKKAAAAAAAEAE